jgi:hypothetical protein
MGGPRQRGPPGRSLKDLKKEIDTKNRSSAEVCILLLMFSSLYFRIWSEFFGFPDTKIKSCPRFAGSGSSIYFLKLVNALLNHFLLKIAEANNSVDIGMAHKIYST